MTVSPRVRVVVVNWNGGELTLRCLEHLAATEWDPDRLELVVVDNASTDGSADAVARAFPQVRLVRSPRNVGFGAANNLALASRERIDQVALVNNDAFVEPGWLAPLAAALEEDHGLGAACPKILLDGAFAELVLEARTHVRGRGDPRPLGVRVLERDGLWFAEGFHGRERTRDERFQWTAGRARLLAADPGAAVELVVASDREKPLTVRSGSRETRGRAGPRAAPLRVEVEPLAVPVLNSAGGVLLPAGFGGDRGFLEPDRGQLDRPDEVEAWSACAVLLRASYLDDVGLFDPGLFLYYEDLDLSLRGRARGWRYAYVPASVVRHRHGSSSRVGSELFEVCNERNRLLVQAKLAPWPDAARALADSLRTTALHVERDVLAPLARGERPDTTFVRRRLRATRGALAGLPRVLRERRRVASGNGAGR